MNKNNLRDNNQGMVAITTTLVIMILITLIVSSFSLVVRREQRQSLDRQLSTQAFYAAESGIQDAINALDRGIISGNIDDCSEFFTQANIPDGTITNVQNQANVSYSCVLIDSVLESLNYSSIDPVDGTYLIPINPESGIDKIRISWQNRDAPDTSFAAGNMGDFPQSGGELPTGMPRVTLMDGDANGRQDLINGTKTSFLYPNASAADEPGVVGFDDADGALVEGNCRTNRGLFCASEITGLNPGNDRYFLAVRALYKPIKMQITAFNGDTEVALSGAQTEIDVTGRAADVLRRVQVRYSSGGGSDKITPARLVPGAALETTQGICKKFEVSSDRFKNLCEDNNWIGLDSTTVPNGGTVPSNGPVIDEGITIGEGNAAIGGECLATEVNCTPTANWPEQDPRLPLYRWGQSFLNESDNDSDEILNCTWIWGDGTERTYNANQCEYGDRVNYTYSNMSSLIESTNGNEGCRIYSVTLIMRFTPESRKQQKTDSTTTAIPGGNAARRDGICWGKHRPYTP